MNERPKPYVGISGVVNTEQQQFYTDKFHELGLAQSRRLALGVKAVHKTQMLDVANKYGPAWYPVGEAQFADALEPSGDTLRVAQAYLDIDHVGDPDYRDEFINRICKRGKTWLNAIQFDMLPWHQDESMLGFVEKVKAKTGHEILLQVHGEAMSRLGPDAVPVVLGKYAHALDYILFDASHGKGVRLNSGALAPFVEASHDYWALKNVGIGVAGGLNAQVVREDLPALLSDYPGLSWDAEGQLHEELPDGSRPLSTKRTVSYLESTAHVLKTV